tara:strand:- start:241 stop:468 length:228 start_codon:yes stop_codon:yes gene_type:complete
MVDSGIRRGDRLVHVAVKKQALASAAIDVARLGDITQGLALTLDPTPGVHGVDPWQKSLNHAFRFDRSVDDLRPV